MEKMETTLTDAQARALINDILAQLEDCGVSYYTIRDVRRGQSQYLEVELSIKIKG